MKERPLLLGLFHRRECVVPTWRGWLILAGTLTVLFTIAIRGAYGFLALNDPISARFLVVEGWSPDYTIAEAIAEYRRHSYEAVLVTGGPIEIGHPLLHYKTFADLGTATLQRMGMDPALIQTVPAPAVGKDRSYASAMTVKRWLHARGTARPALNLLGHGAHCRRTRLLYEKAFRGEAEIGIIACEEKSFEPDRWWSSSQGFRSVVGEMIAYAYARLFFWPSKE